MVPTAEEKVELLERFLREQRRLSEQGAKTVMWPIPDGVLSDTPMYDVPLPAKDVPVEPIFGVRRKDTGEILWVQPVGLDDYCSPGDTITYTGGEPPKVSIRFTGDYP